MPSNVLLKKTPTSPAVVGPPTGVADVPQRWTLLTGVGLVLMFVGWLDVGLLWYPLQLKQVEWEFATVVATFNALPLSTLGFALAGFAAVSAGNRALQRVLIVLSPLVVLVLLGMFMLFALAVVAGHSFIDPQAKPLFLRAVGKTSVLAVTYVSLFTWMGWMLIRSSKPKEHNS